MDPQDRKYTGLFEKSLVIWKLYLVSGTTWFYSTRAPNWQVSVDGRTIWLKTKRKDFL